MTSQKKHKVKRMAASPQFKAAYANVRNRIRLMAKELAGFNRNRAARKWHEAISCIWELRRHSGNIPQDTDFLLLLGHPQEKK
jgi:hypothetical protein